MAQMNPNIILAGQPANVLGAIQQGNQAAAQTNQIRQQNALSGLYKTQGAGIASGEQGALNALAGIDPFAAQAARGAAQDQQFSAEKMQMVRDSAKREAAAHAASMGAAEASAEAAKIERAVAAGLAAQTPEEWDALAQQLGAPDLVGQFENRQAIAFSYLGIADALKEAKGPEPLSPEGKLQADIAAGLVPPGQAAKVIDAKDVDSFRKEFSGLPAVKAFSSQAQAYGRIIASAKDPSPAGDLALIFNFMKVLDPGSVVRESEFATAESASAWLQQSEETGTNVPRPIAQAIRALSTGQRLSPEQRQDFVGRGGALYDNAERVYGAIEGQFRSIAEQRGYPAGQGVIDFRYTGDRGSVPGQGSQPQSPAGQPLQASPDDDALIQKWLGATQ